MIFYKIDILKELKKAGYNTSRLRRDKILREATIQRLRTSEPVNIKTLDTVCELLSMQPGDIIGHKPGPASDHPETPEQG